MSAYYIPGTEDLEMNTMLFLALGSMALGQVQGSLTKTDRGMIRGPKEGSSQQTGEFNKAS